MALQIAPAQRRNALFWTLGEWAHESALVFCNFKKTVAEVTEALHAVGASAACLHGDLDQFARDQVMARFRNGSVRILVATDVAARGIDVAELDLVVNYEQSPQPEVYVHRVGRTGRAERQGAAVSLFEKREASRLHDIEDRIEGLLDQRPFDRSKNGAHGADLITLAKRFARPADMETILISGGRKDKIRKGDILGALTGDAGGLSGDAIGAIELHDRLSYVAVVRAHAKTATASINRGRIKKRRFRATLIRNDA